MEEAGKRKAKKSLPFNATQQHVKNVNMVIQCEECEMWRIVYSKKKLDPQSLSVLEKIMDDVVYTCGTTFDELDLSPTLQSVCVRIVHCNDPMEKAILFLRFVSDTSCSNIRPTRSRLLFRVNGNRHWNRGRAGGYY